MGQGPWASLDYGEERHMLRMLGEWRNMIGYKNGICTGQGLHYDQDFSSEENDMVVNMATLLVGRVLRLSSVLGNLRLLDKRNMTSRGLQLGIVVLFLSSLLLILFVIPTVASNNLVLGWNSWPTGALLHHRSLNRPWVLTKSLPMRDEGQKAEYECWYVPKLMGSGVAYKWGAWWG